jgi:Flp pilus assembly protein TadD
VGTYVSPDEVRKSAAEKIRKRFDMVGGAMRDRRLERYLEQGRVAFAAGDYRAAAAAYEQAARLAPDDEEIVEKARMAAERASRMG